MQKNLHVLPLFALLLCNLASAQINLQITEISYGQAGFDLTEDWIEIRNNGNEAWVSGVDPDLYYDDESAAPAEATPIQGLTDIQPGETVLILITGNTDDIANFIIIWGSVIDLTGIEIGYTDGAGLGNGGDAVTLWLGAPNTTLPVASASYPDATLYDGQTYDSDLGEFSVVGNANGAVQTFAGGGDNFDVPNIGSPGNQEPNNTQEAFNSSFSIYPNPTTDRVLIRSKSAVQIETIEVLDATGRLVLRRTSDLQSSAELDLSTLTAGMYLVQVRSATGIFVERLIKQ